MIPADGALPHSGSRVEKGFKKRAGKRYISLTVSRGGREGTSPA